MHNAGSAVASMTWLNHWSVQQIAGDAAARDAIGRLTFVGVDGVALRKLLRAAPARTSADLVVPTLLARLERPRLAVVGARQDVNRAAATELLAMTSGGSLAAAVDGYDELPSTAEAAGRWAAELAPSVVVVGLGAGRQERFAAAVAAGMKAGIVVTCGGFLDQVVQAEYYPPWAYPLRLNWLVRLVREPHRLWRRYTIDAARAFARRSALQRQLDDIPGFARYRELVSSSAAH